MLIYRIERQKYLATTLHGIGAASSEGFRWNSLHTNMVYTSDSKALAMLEVSVHLDIAENLPTDRVFVSIKIPDKLKIKTLDIEDLPDSWNAKPPMRETQLLGDAFVREGHTAIMKVPSAIIPTEYNYLINPFHSKSKLIQVASTEVIQFDDRLFT